jgi:hypothetical protein
VFFLRHSLFDIQYSAVRFLISCSFTRAPPLAKKTASLIGKETLTLRRNYKFSIFRTLKTR